MSCWTLSFTYPLSVNVLNRPCVTKDNLYPIASEELKVHNKPQNKFKRSVSSPAPKPVRHPENCIYISDPQKL